MHGDVLRFATLAALIAGLLTAVSSAAQVGSGKIAFTNDAGIYTINPDGTAPTLLRAGMASRLGGWSPDGSQVAFTCYNGGAYNDRLIVMNADGSGEHVVTSGQIALGRHPWSSDGARVAWGPLPNTAGNIYTASAAGGGVRHMTVHGQGKEPPG